MSGDILPLPQHAFMAWCSIKKKSTGKTLNFMYVYMYVYTYVCMYVCMYVCIC
jgi:hypothetical protein